MKTINQFKLIELLAHSCRSRIHLRSTQARRAALSTVVALVAAACCWTVLAQETATVTTDKDTYVAGETVSLSGDNWQPGEIVNLVVDDDKGQAWKKDVNVTATTDGTISYRFALPSTFVATMS